MDWCYGSGINDFLVSKDQSLSDRLPSPDSWSNWGISAPEGFNSTRKFSVMDTNPTEVEFNFNDENFNNEIELELESCLHEKDPSSSSSVCGGLLEQSFQQAALPCDQPNYRLQDLSRFEQMDDIFLDCVLQDLPKFENPNESAFFSEFQSSKTPGGLQKDTAASTFFPCNSKSNNSMDTEAPPVKFLAPFDWSSGEEGIYEQSSLEEAILQDLEWVIAQFTEKSRICFRDALYRLARNTQQQHVMEDQDGDFKMPREMPQTDHNETVRSEDKKPMESETNSVDRVIANLMFNKMEINVQDLLLPTPIRAKREMTENKGLLQGKSSKALNHAQNLHHPILLDEAEDPKFARMNCQTAADLHPSYTDPAEQSFMLEFG